MGGNGLLLRLLLLFFLMESAVAAGPFEMASLAAVETFAEGSFDTRSGVMVGAGGGAGGGCVVREDMGALPSGWLDFSLFLGGGWCSGVVQ